MAKSQVAKKATTKKRVAAKKATAKQSKTKCGACKDTQTCEEVAANLPDPSIERRSYSREEQRQILSGLESRYPTTGGRPGEQAYQLLTEAVSIETRPTDFHSLGNILDQGCRVIHDLLPNLALARLDFSVLRSESASRETLEQRLKELREATNCLVAAHNALATLRA